MASPPLRPEIAGRDGRPLPVLIDLPEEGAVTAGWAIFAHCFTCSAASTAATRIARGLAAEGFGVLRVDFTGSGEGREPPAPDFAADVEDIILAAGWLERSHAAPVLLIGHSLGGTARLAAVRAVATIGAPSAPEHILHHLGRAADDALDDGRAVLPLGSGTITVTRDFVQGVRETDVLRGLGRLHKALLVMHAPLDQIVGIDEATRIFVAARHPKSFVSLDTADHLLNGAADAAYAAGVIAAWAARYTRDDRAGHRHGARAGAPDAAAVDAATAATSSWPTSRWRSAARMVARHLTIICWPDLAPAPR